MIRKILATLAALALAGPIQAATLAEIQRYWNATQLDRYVEILSDGGVDYGVSLDDYYLLGKGGADWKVRVEVIYDPDRLSDEMKSEVRAELEPLDLTDALAFFESELGQRIVSAEYAALDALSHADVWEATQRMMVAPDAILPRREALFGRLMDAGGYLDTALASQLNGQIAFIQGLTSHGAFAGIMAEREMMDWLAGEEPTMRAALYDWTRALFYLSYKGFDDHELEQLVTVIEQSDVIGVTSAVYRGIDRVQHRCLGELGAEVARSYDEDAL